MGLSRSLAKRLYRLREWLFMRRVARAARDPQFRFVQVGANDGLMGDPIRAWVLRGHWHGVLVEPQQAMYEALQHNYAGHAGRLQFVRAAIAEQAGTRTLWRLKPEHVDRNWKRGLGSLNRTTHLRDDRQVETEEVPCMTFDDLLRTCNLQQVDFLQMDVEGYDLRLLELFPFTRLRPSFIRFERAHLDAGDDARARALLAREGYRFVALRYDYAAWQPATR